MVLKSSRPNKEVFQKNLLFVFLLRFWEVNKALHFSQPFCITLEKNKEKNIFNKCIPLHLLSKIIA